MRSTDEPNLTTGNQSNEVQVVGGNDGIIDVPPDAHDEQLKMTDETIQASLNQPYATADAESEHQLQGTATTPTHPWRQT